MVEALFAEGLTTSYELRPDIAIPDAPDSEEHALAEQWRRQLAEWRLGAEKDAEERVDRGGVELDGIPDEELPRDPIALDDRIRELSERLASRDLVMGELARRLFATDGWRRLGYGSAAQYCRERPGVS